MADVSMKVNTGLEITTSRMKGLGTEPKYIGWGTGTTPPVTTNAGLETPAAEARVNGTSTQETTNSTNDTYQVAGILTCAGAAKAITEIATFDAASNGKMDIRGTFLPINVSVGDSIQFIIQTVYDQA